MDTANLVDFFCIFDEFCKYFEIELKKHVIEDSSKRHRKRKGQMSDSEIMTILVLFHTSHFRDLKTFYLGYICQHMRKEFPQRIHYNRFVERQTLRQGTDLSALFVVFLRERFGFGEDDDSMDAAQVVSEDVGTLTRQLSGIVNLTPSTRYFTCPDK